MDAIDKLKLMMELLVEKVTEIGLSEGISRAGGEVGIVGWNVDVESGVTVVDVSEDHGELGAVCTEWQVS